MPSGHPNAMSGSAGSHSETQRQGKYFSYLLKSSVEVMLFIDRHGRIAYCTDAMLRLAGIGDFASIAGRPYQYLYAKFGGDALVRKGTVHFEQVRQALQASSLEVHINFPGGGNSRVYGVNVAPMIDGGGAFDGAIVTHYDTTETQRIAQKADARSRELEVQMQAALVASEAKSRFLASMSHEIRTPMNAIIGMSDLMRTDNLDMTQRTFFDDIKKMSKSLLQIINDVLDFSRIEAGRLEIAPVHFNLQEMFNNICSMCRFLAEAKGLYFYCSYGDGMPAAVYGDDVRIRQVAFNIVNNAIRYTREGHVSFSVKKTAKGGCDYIAFVAKDTGIGIKEDDLEKLFNAFYQVDMAVNRGVGGSGLGLSITKNLVTLMGGEIDVKSTYGEGSEFTILLPLAEGDPELVEGRRATPIAKVAGDARVLVVDDSQINLKVAAAYLERHNIYAETALSGPEALVKIQRAGGGVGGAGGVGGGGSGSGGGARPYDLVFMDHMMPIMDGVETAHKIREMGYPDLPIVALTANAIEGIGDLYLQSDMNDFLTKPIDPEKLNKALVRWLPAHLLQSGGDDAAGVGAGEAAGASAGEAAQASAYGQGYAAPADSGYAHNPYINYSTGINNALGDRSLYDKILSDFLAEHRSDSQKIKNAIDSGMLAEATRAAHTLKGIAAQIGANRLRQVSFSIETLLAEGEPGKAGKALQKLEQELADAASAIEQLLQH